MKALTAETILQIWEGAKEQHAVDRALTILQGASPEANREDLADLPIGRRDAQLLAIRCHTFGTTLNSIASCPQCQEQVEVSFNLLDLLKESEGDEENTMKINIQNYHLEYRIPNSRDLAALFECQNSEDARGKLMTRCIGKASKEGSEIMPTELPETVIETVTAKIIKLDPLLEVLLNLNCPHCEKAWQVPFDILSFLWSEIAAKAKQLLQEIHCLATVYGWSEQEILSLSPVRRKGYMEMVMA